MPKVISEKIIESFYFNLLHKLLQKEIINKDINILIVGGGSFDIEVFEAHGFKNITLSNIDEGQINDGVVADGTKLPYGDKTFDIVVAHATIHHMDKPHSCICEMYRVSNKLMFFIESQDSFFMKMAVSIGLVEQFESNAIRDSGFERGGVNDLPIPNYVYRWTKREIIKLLNSYEPRYQHHIDYLPHWNFNSKRVSRRIADRYPVLENKLVFILIDFLLIVFNFFFKGQGNELAVIIRKDLSKKQPWIIKENNKYYFDKSFSTKDIINASR